MIDPEDMSIAGSKKIRHWTAFRTKLTPGGSQDLWKKAFREYFHSRINLRYLPPVKTLQEHDRLRGEGFSIMTIECSLVEFLESTVQGISYRYVKNPEGDRKFEHCKSQEVFVNFLTERQPFSIAFN